ncbi:MAG TPA: carbonic anhydrase, partial [Alteromonas sp.]|nr:carbonic anhydrase [Alteromonas sp.]
VKERCGCDSLNKDDHLQLVTEENVVQQLQHLRTHPAVAAKIATGQVQLHGWFYNIETAEVLNYDEKAGKFVPMESAFAAEEQ